MNIIVFICLVLWGSGLNNATKASMVRSVSVRQSDFLQETVIIQTRTLQMCQYYCQKQNCSAFYVDKEQDICHLGVLQAVLPRLASGEPGQMKVFAVSERIPERAIHLQVFIGKGEPAQDFSTNSQLSPALESISQWTDKWITLISAVWSYKGGMLFCSYQDCYMKLKDQSPAFNHSRWNQARDFLGGYGVLHGKPWVLGGQVSDSDKILSSEILEPWGEWVYGPDIPEYFAGPACVVDLGNGKIMVAGVWDGYIGWMYNTETNIWSQIANYVGVRIMRPACTVMTNPNNNRKIVFLVGGQIGGFTSSNRTFVYDIGNESWLDGPVMPRIGKAGVLSQIAGSVYLFGGWAENGTVLKLLPDMSGWEYVPGWDLPTGALDAPVVLTHN